MKRTLSLIILTALLLISACAPATPPPSAPAPTAAPAATAAPTATAVLPAATSAPTAQALQPAPRAMDAATAAPWDALLTERIAPGNQLFCDAPGAVLLVDTPAGRYLKAAGVASLDSKRPMATSDRFEIGSNTKAFTAILALQLQEDGVLSLDDLLSKWLPDLATRIPNGDQITLRQLAGHTSGLWDYEEALIGPIYENDQAAMTRGYTPQELIDFVIANGTPDFAPGKGWKYSNSGYIVLGMAVEAAAGKPLAQLYQERIFDPLGMTSTSYPEGSPEPGSLVDGYYAIPNVGLTSMTAWNASQGGAAGAIISTAEDMARFIEGLFGGKIFKNKATLDEMLAMRPLSQEESLAFPGYGLGLLTFKTEGFIAIGHEGMTPGYQTMWMYVPEADATFIFLTNSGTCQLFFVPRDLSAEAFGLQPSATEITCPAFELPYPRPEPDYSAKGKRDLSPFAEALAAFTPERAAELDALLADADIPTIQQAFERKELSSEELVTYYLDRIRRYDLDRLNSVMELNPQALEIARQMDAERAAGKQRGPLHGIPVLLKDNIATGDGMHTTAGAYALKDWQPDRDAFLVQRLREAGALILGKANMSEWANYMDNCMPAGFSTLGGQTRNPYGPFDTLGSSSGPAAAVAANLATVSVGSETQGSIIKPAEINSVVGLKTSMGLVSRDYVVPLLERQDVPGPMGRSVTDVAILLTAMAGVDPNDPATQEAAPLAGTDFTQFARAGAAQGMRVGIVIQTDAEIEQFIVDLKANEEQAKEMRSIFVEEREATRRLGRVFSDLGLTVVEISVAAAPPSLDPAPLFAYGFKDDLNRFLAGLGDKAPIASLEAVIALNQADMANRAPYGQGLLEEAQGTSLTEAEYAALKEQFRRETREGLSRLFAENDLDAFISQDQAYAQAGFPAILLPNGYDKDGKPLGVTLVGNYLGEPALIAIGYAFEQSEQRRVPPDLEKTITQIEALPTK